MQNSSKTRTCLTWLLLKRSVLRFAAALELALLFHDYSHNRTHGTGRQMDVRGEGERRDRLGRGEGGRKGGREINN